jgi:hypothetical protein
MMQRDRSKTVRAFVTSVAGAFALLWSAAAFAGTPTLEPDCGIGATIVGSDSAGKVTLGKPDPSLEVSGTCTLTFGAPYTNAPACSASNETNSGGLPTPIGTRTTAAALELVFSVPGDVISYVCADY